MPDRTRLDVLMITYNRPDYTRLSLRRALESCDEAMRLWVWHNGDDEPTLNAARSMQDHRHFHRLHHCRENRLLRDAINWLFAESDADLLGILNDDCLVSDDWGARLRRVHDDVDEAGVLAGWHFPVEDFDPALAAPKIRTLAGGHRIMVNPWVQGSGVVVKRACVEQLGPLLEHETGFTGYGKRAALAGWINGWPVPLIPIDHMDDPRSPNTALRTDLDIARRLPMSAQDRGIRTVDQWLRHLRRSAHIVQTAPSDPRAYVGLRKRFRRLWTRVKLQEPMY